MEYPSDFRIEFPDFDAATMPVLPEGFIDNSWHNDTMPSFHDLTHHLVVWIDYADASRREFPDADFRFSVSVCDDDGGSFNGDGDLLFTNDWDAVLALLAKECEHPKGKTWAEMVNWD